MHILRQAFSNLFPYGSHKNEDKLDLSILSTNFFFKNVFIWKTVTQRKNTSIRRSQRPELSQVEIRCLNWVSHMGAVDQALGPCAVLPSPLAGSWITRGAARTGTCAYMECRHHSRQRPYPLCRNANFCSLNSFSLRNENISFTKMILP